MKTGKVSIKSIIITVIVLLVGVLSVLLITNVSTFITGAAAGAEPKNVLAVPSEDGKSATITWTTEKSVQGVVEYGANAASLLLRAPETEATTSHKITVTPLKSNQNYFFRIRVGEEIYDNGGIPYSFKTKLGVETMVSPTLAPAVPSLMPTLATSGGCVAGVDYNKDGVTNTLDYLGCLKTGQKPVSPTPTIAGGCKTGDDFDKNGVVNSLDMIKCLQTKK